MIYICSSNKWTYLWFKWIVWYDSDAWPGIALIIHYQYAPSDLCHHLNQPEVRIPPPLLNCYITKKQKIPKFFLTESRFSRSIQIQSALHHFQRIVKLSDWRIWEAKHLQFLDKPSSLFLAPFHFCRSCSVVCYRRHNGTAPSRMPPMRADINEVINYD